MSCKDFCRLMFLFFDWDLYYSFSLGVEILLSVCRLFWFTWFCPDLLLRFMCSACYSDFWFPFGCPDLIDLVLHYRSVLYVPIYGSRYCPDLNRIQCSDLVWIIDLSVVLFCSVWLSWFIRSCAELTFGFNCSGFMISLSCWFGSALVFWHDLIYIFRFVCSDLLAWLGCVISLICRFGFSHFVFVRPDLCDSVLIAILR